MTEDNRHELILDHLRALRDGQTRLENAVRLLLDSRVVDLTMAYIPIFALLLLV